MLVIWLLCFFSHRTDVVANLFIARSHISTPEEEIDICWMTSVYALKKEERKEIGAYIFSFSCVYVFELMTDVCVEWMNNRLLSEIKKLETMVDRWKLFKGKAIWVSVLVKFCWSSLKSQCLHLFNSWIQLFVLRKWRQQETA